MDGDPNRQFGVAARQGVAGRTGREFLQAIIDGRPPPPPIAKILSFAGAQVRKGLKRRSHA